MDSNTISSIQSGGAAAMAADVRPARPPAQAEAPAIVPAPQPPEAVRVSARGATQEVVDRAIEAVASRLQSVSRDLDFSVDPSTGREVVRLVDRSTGEVLLQIPSEQALAVSRRLDAMRGVFVREET